MWCPRELYIFTLRPQYINALYSTTPAAFPKRWNIIKDRDPIAAWHSLNQTIVKHQNAQYSTQGIVVDKADTSSDFYNIYHLKQEIKETIAKSIKEELAKACLNLSGPDAIKAGQSAVDVDLMMSKMRESLRVVNSEAVKRTGREVVPQPTATLGGPHLGTVGPSFIRIKPETDNKTSTYSNVRTADSGEWK